jgi:hypothetical protein
MISSITYRDWWKMVGINGEPQGYVVECSMPIGRWIADQDRNLWHRMPSPSFLVDRFIINESLMTLLVLRWTQ